jgi:hypothetical protein
MAGRGRPVNLAPTRAQALALVVVKAGSMRTASTRRIEGCPLYIAGRRSPAHQLRDIRHCCHTRRSRSCYSSFRRPSKVCNSSRSTAEETRGLPNNRSRQGRNRQSRRKRVGPGHDTFRLVGRTHRNLAGLPAVGSTARRNCRLSVHSEPYLELRQEDRHHGMAGCRHRHPVRPLQYP